MLVTAIAMFVAEVLAADRFSCPADLANITMLDTAEAMLSAIASPTDTNDGPALLTLLRSLTNINCQVWFAQRVCCQHVPTHSTTNMNKRAVKSREHV